MQKKILVVGEQVNGLAIGSLLEHAGYQVTTASNCLAAWQMLIASYPDLVILGKTILKLDGLELCRNIRQLDARLPVLALAAKDDEEAVIASLEAGADACLVQPLSEREFLARVGAILHRHRVWLSKADCSDSLFVNAQG